MANNKFDSNIIITAEKWHLFNQINILLETFYIVTQQCNKNNAQVWCRMHKHWIFYVLANSLENSSVSTTSAEIIEDSCVKRLYTTNNKSRLKLNDYSLLLVTTTVDPRYRLSVFPPNLKSKVDKLLKLEVKTHGCRETGQSGASPIVSPNNSRPQSHTNVDPKNCLSLFFLCLKQKQPDTKTSNNIRLM